MGRQNWNRQININGMVDGNGRNRHNWNAR